MGREPNRFRRYVEQPQQGARQNRFARYVEGGPQEIQHEATLAETVEDVGHSAVTGFQRGLAMQAGMSGDIHALQGDAAVWGARELGRLFGHELTPEQERGIRDTVNLVPLMPTDVAQFVAPVRVRNPDGSGQVRISGRAPTSTEINEGIQRVAGPQHTPTTTAGEYARTIAEFVPAAFGGEGGLITRGARVVVPAVASETAGQVTEGTELEPYARLIAALAGSGVNEGFVQVLRRGGRTPDERGLRLIMRELQDQGQAPEEIVRQANVLLRQAPTEEVLAETLGPGGLRLARAIANLGRGSGRSTAEEALAARADGRPSLRATQTRPAQTATTSIRDRIMNEAVRMTAPQQGGTPRSYWDALEALKRARGAQGGEAYAAAYAAQPDAEAVQQALLPYMRQAPPEAIASANRQLESVAGGLRAQIAAGGQRGATAEALQRLQAELDDVLASQSQLQALTRGEAPNGLNTRTIDYVGRGLSQMERAAGLGSPEARALGETRRAYQQMADEIVPELGQARSHYGASMRIEELMDEGRQVFNRSEGQIDRVMRGSGGSGLTTEEFDGFMLGVLDSIENKLGSSDTGFLARLMRNENWRNQLTRAVGGEAQAKRFLQRLAREANMQNTRNYVVAGSRTAGLQDDIAALTQGEQELAFISDNARALIANGGQLRPLVIRWALSAFDRFNRPGLRNPEVQEALARRLFARVSRESSKELRDALIALRTDREVPPQVRAWITRMTAVSAANDDRFDGEQKPEPSLGPEGSLSDAYIGARREAEGSPP